MRGTILIISMLLGINGIAQDDYWREAMASPNPNYFKACASYNNYWKGKEKVKHSGYKQFERWCFAVQPYVQTDGSIKPYAQVWQTAVDYHRANASRSANGNWQELGPYQEKNYGRGVGRLTVIAFHPTDTATFYVGSPSGGIWITHDDGATWENPKDDIMNFGVSAICVDPKNPAIIYIGTGDADGLDTDGTGVYKSEDGGKTWTRRSLGMNDQTVSKLLIDPDSSNILHATTRNGIFKTTNSAMSWVVKRTSGDFRDMEMKPGDPNTLYAAQWSNQSTSSYIFVSRDKGETWVRKFVTEGLFPDTRYEIEVAPTNPDLLVGIGGNRMVKSFDSGDTFKTVIDSGDFLLNITRQGWYNASFRIDPADENIMYCGNVRLYKSYDAGLSWVRINHTHADNHYIEIHPITSELFVLDDGGIHRSKDGGKRFTDITNLGISAIYRISQSPFDRNHALSGFQDCGSKYYNGYEWTSTYGADGMQPLYDVTDSTIFYTGYQYGGIVRYLSHIGSAQVIEHPEDEGGWITPYILDVNDNETMYQGRESVWKSTNLHTKDRKDVAWTNIGTGVAANVGRYMRLKQHRTIPSRMLAITQNDNRSASRFIKCDDIYDTNYVWVDFNSYPAISNLADFETDPFDSLAIYLVVNDVIQESRDGGGTFTSISENLPRVPYHVIEIDTVTGNLYVGGDAGAFCRIFGDTLWQSFNNGLTSAARIRDLDIYYDPADHSKSKIKCATYGRGLWESDLIGVSTAKPKSSSAYVLSESKTYTYEKTFKIEINFKQHLYLDSVSQFDQTKIQVVNGTILNFTPKGRVFEAEIEAVNEGFVYVDIPQGAAISGVSGLPTDSAKTFRIDYLPQPIGIGPNGPGGVGDSTSLMLWLRGDNLMVDQNGDTLRADGDKIEKWYDVAGRDFYAEQTVDSSKPKLRLDSNGINGWPAVEYNPPNRFLMLRDFGPVGSDITVFAMAKSNTPNWTGHSWIANSRTHNGFLIHNSNNSMYTYGVTVDGNRRYLSTPSVNSTNVMEAHVYTIRYNERMWKNEFYVDDGLGIDYLTSDHIRDPLDSINIRLGKDNNTRYGDGKLGEMIYYREDIGNARRIIVANYLASKYEVDLKSDKRYTSSPDFRYKVAGIGRTNELDGHEEAVSGIIRLSAPSSLDNGDFLLWGHNEDSLIWDTVQVGNAILFKRIWHVSETGDVGAFTITIDSAALGTVSNDLAIKIGSLSDLGSNAGRWVLLQKQGSSYTAIVDLDDDDYFTFGTSEDLFSSSDEAKLFEHDLRIVPNPMDRGKAELRMYTQEAQSFDLVIIDNSGRQIYQKQVNIGAGNHSESIDISAYSQGVYHVVVRNSAGSRTIRLVR